MYVDVLRKINSSAKLVSFRKNINKIRCSKKGDLMLELKQSLNETAEYFQSNLEILENPYNVKILVKLLHSPQSREKSHGSIQTEIYRLDPSNNWQLVK